MYSFFGRPGPASSASTARRSAPDASRAAAAGRGRRVRHPVLGDGVVLDSEGEGEMSKLTVYFDRVGKRKLIAKYAGLEYL